MIDFLQNSLVINIGGGIISGIIVYFFAKWIFQWREKSKHAEQLNAANSEIIRILNPYVIENGFPDQEIINAIILSTSRRFKLKSKELFSIRTICQELIRKVVENRYVSNDKKKEYSNHLRDYLSSLDSQKDEDSFAIDFGNDLKESLEDNKKTTSGYLEIRLLVSIAAALFTIILLQLNLFDRAVTISAVSLLTIFIIALSLLALNITYKMNNNSAE